MKKTVRNGICVASIVLFAILSGCVTAPRGIWLAEKDELPAGESVVFGRIDTSEESLAGCSATVIDVRSSLPIREQRIGETFCWHLPPGIYAINSIRSHSKKLVYAYKGKAIHETEDRGHGRLYTEFVVGAPGQVVYVGCLNLTMGQNGLSASVTDEADFSLQIVRESRPWITCEPVKCLFNVEDVR